MNWDNGFDCSVRNVELKKVDGKSFDFSSAYYFAD